MHQILEGVDSLHRNSIIHRDIKAENLVFSRKDIFDNIKIIDFGSATFFSQL